MGDYRKLEVWQRARALAVAVDVESRRMRRGNAELADQLRRACLSVPTNIAEGAVRSRDSEFQRFVVIAIGSAAEADSLLMHAADIAALDRTRCNELLTDLTIIRKMLFKLRRAIAPDAALR